MAGNDQNSFSPISANDHAGILWILSLLSGIYTLLTLLVRYIIKRPCLGADDWAFLAATILACAAFATTYDGLSNGVGKSNDLVSEDDLRHSSRSIFAGRILFVFSLAVSKCSVTLLIRRLFPEDMVVRRRVCLYSLIIFVILGLASALSLSVGCDSEHLLDDPEGKCPGQMSRWSVVMGIDIVTEVAIVLMSFFLLASLRVKSDLKWKVIAAFAFRLLLVVTSILILVYIHNYIHSDRPNFAIVSSVSTQSIHLLLHVFTATVPNLKSFLVSFDTGLMMVLSRRQLGEKEEPEKDYDSGGGFFKIRGKSRKGPYALSSMNNEPSEPVMVRGQARAYDRGSRGAQRDSEDSGRDSLTIAPVQSRSRSDFLSRRAGSSSHGRSSHEDGDDDSGSREAGSVGAESQERMIHWRRGS